MAYRLNICGLLTGLSMAFSFGASAPIHAADLAAQTQNARLAHTQQIASEFQLARGTALVSHQLGLASFLAGAQRDEFEDVFALAHGAPTSGLANGQSFQFRLQASISNTGPRNTKYLFGVVGSHFEVNPHLLLGVMLQRDLLDQDEGVAGVDGTGWMAGPYVVAQIPDRQVFVEGRMLYGESANNTSPQSTYTDRFRGDRRLAQIRVSGKLERRQITLIPSVQASYVSDRREAYVDGLGQIVPEQGLALSRFEIGLGFERAVAMPQGRGQMKITGGIKAIGSSVSGIGDLSRVPNYARRQARIDFGTDYRMTNGGRVVASAYLDGIGVKDYENFGGQFGFSLKF